MNVIKKLAVFCAIVGVILAWILGIMTQTATAEYSAYLQKTSTDRYASLTEKFDGKQYDFGWTAFTVTAGGTFGVTVLLVALGLMYDQLEISYKTQREICGLLSKQNNEPKQND